MDGHGRIRIPPELKEAAGLTGEVVIRGAIRSIEIWNRENLDAYTQKSANYMSEIKSKLPEIGL